MTPTIHRIEPHELVDERIADIFRKEGLVDETYQDNQFRDVTEKVVDEQAEIHVDLRGHDIIPGRLRFFATNDQRVRLALEVGEWVEPGHLVYVVEEVEW